MAGGLRFADAGANHFPSFRAWPKTFGDLISSDAHFVGHFRVFHSLGRSRSFWATRRRCEAAPDYSPQTALRLESARLPLRSLETHPPR